MTTAENAADWNSVIKREARGTDGTDFGEVQEVGPKYVVTQKGTISKKKFFLPKACVQGFDGDKLYFNATETDLNEWEGESARTDDYYTKYTENPRHEIASDIETRIPLLQERVAKTADTSDVTVRKEKVTEMKTVPVEHEELRVEKKPGTVVTEEGT